LKDTEFLIAMKADMSEISDQLERDVRAATVAVRRLDQLASYCAARATQPAMAAPDTWNSRRDSYLRSKITYDREHEKLTTLL
jgi:hypothetical protein